MRFSLRSLVLMAIFGALWGAVEISLGAVLHTVKVPFPGLILSGIGITIALIGRLVVPRPGSVLFIGLVTALLKMLSLGSVVLYPMIGIVAESLLAELALSTLGRPRRLSFIVAGALATLWPLVHPFLTQGVLAGAGIWQVYEWTVGKGAKLLGLDPSAFLWILAALAAIHLLTGCLGGVLAWDAGRAVLSRLRPTTADRNI